MTSNFEHERSRAGQETADCLDLENVPAFESDAAQSDRCAGALRAAADERTANFPPKLLQPVSETKSVDADELEVSVVQATAATELLSGVAARLDSMSGCEWRGERRMASPARVICYGSVTNWPRKARACGVSSR